MCAVRIARTSSMPSRLGWRRSITMTSKLVQGCVERPLAVGEVRDPVGLPQHLTRHRGERGVVLDT